MGYFLIGIGALMVVWAVLRWVTRAAPGELAAKLPTAGVVLAFVLGVVLALTGRLAAAVPLFLLAVGLWRKSQSRLGKTDIPPRASGQMRQAEALDVLGLRQGASADEIRAAHRKLIQKLHPDHGGSASLAARVNEAKDVLLRRGA